MLLKFKVNSESAKENCNLLTFQVSLTLTFVCLVGYTVYMIQYLSRSHSDALVVIFTFIFAFIVDQCKSVISHVLIYLVVVRRFGFLKENQKDFVLQQNLMIKNENFIPRV